MILVHALAILVALPLALAQACVVEWVFERFWLHRGWRPERWYIGHALVHHQLCRYADTFRITEAEQEEALSPSIGAAISQVIVGSIPWAFVSSAAWLAGWDGSAWTFLGTFVLVLVLDQAIRGALHRRLHAPGSGALERTRLFRSIERRHQIHHARPERNLNLLLPLADRAFGTLLADAAVPATTPVTARRMARRYSRYGEALRLAAPPRGVYGLASPAQPMRRVSGGDGPVVEGHADGSAAHELELAGRS